MEEKKEESQAVNDVIKCTERSLAEFEEKLKHAKTSLQWKQGVRSRDADAGVGQLERDVAGLRSVIAGLESHA